ncbi:MULTISPECIES: VC0807 family protein [Bacillus]|uniref:VC0807 family protein n=1 Tax=Bacillus TaxID=1386 RepID=UPI00209CAEEC|nr:MULTISPECIES: VC0807 family protein [Bacillus]MCP1156400.1 hypothetical protein [Bacillus infantis]MCR6608931.1 hypothetical protein [Bacillus infantis]MDT0163469.1 VC0807 family protein [Bacillus sp. AG4(2022)]
MQKNSMVLDILFYVVLPLVVWNYGRDMLGDYLAMILSSVPGIIYTLYRFFQLKKVNLFGLFLLSNLVIGTMIDVLAGSALQLLWNNVIYSYVLGCLFLLTIVLKKPVFLYFTLDFMELQGKDRGSMKEVFFKSKTLMIFSLITAGFALKFILLASIKVWLIGKYGVDAFDQGIVLRQILNWGFTIVSAGGFYFILKEIGALNEPPETTISQDSP